MRLLGVAAAALLALPSLVFADSARDKFVALSAQTGGIIPLDSQLFRELTARDRDWSVTIQLTAMGAQFKCAPCKEYAPLFRQAANAWQKVPVANRNEHFFAIIDFEHGQDIFRELGMQSAPVTLTYPPTKGPRASTRGKGEPHMYDLSNKGLDIEELVEDLSKYTPVPVPYSKPLPWALILTTIVMVGGIAAAAPLVMPLLRSRWTWALVSVVFILIMVGGEMFTRIRGSPYVYPMRGGGTSWITQGYQNQLGAEVHVLAGAYGLLSFSLVALNSLVTRVPSPARQRTGVILWVGVLFVGYSGLMALFRVKNPAYPFRLLF